MPQEVFLETLSIWLDQVKVSSIVRSSDFEESTLFLSFNFVVFDMCPDGCVRLSSKASNPSQ